MRALLISTYDMGRQPFGLASPAAWLRREGIDVRLVDIAKETLDPGELGELDLVAFHLPMHTATRLAAPVIRAVRAGNPAARICAYGVYAPLNAEWLRSLGVDDVLGGEFEEELTAIATRLRDRSSFGVRRSRSSGRGAGAERANAPNAERRTTNARNGQRHPALAFPRPRPLRTSAAVALRHAAARRRHAADRRLHRSVPRMPSSLPALSDRAGVRRAVPGGAAGGRARRRRSAGGCGRAAHHVRRSRFLQRSHTRPANRRVASRGPSGRLVRRDDQDRAPAPPSRAPPGSSRYRMRVRDERRRIAGRRRARAADEGTYAGRFPRRRRSVSDPRHDARADVRGLSSLDDAGKLLRPSRRDRVASTSSTTSRPFSWRSGCSFLRARACWSWRICARRPGRSIRTR